MSYNNQDVAVSVQKLSKAYKIFETPGKRLLYHLFKANTGKDFYALSDISFDIKKGESFGIIGRNGSGKSTMLQILAGIIKATSGEILVNGKIAALLELGSGFNPENTGYENIYMNAAIMGVKKNEIEKKINEIIEFADIGDFIAQPVKTYSSGMYIRLAFAVAINVDADIILIDEALAVGDLFFRQKCYEKLNQLKREGKTIILVTHAMGEVEQFCDRALLLYKGKQIRVGKSQEVVKEYYLINQEGKVEINDTITTEVLDNNNKSNNTYEFDNGWTIKEEIFFDLPETKEISNGKAKFIKVGLFNKDGCVQRVFQQGEDAYFYYEVELMKNMEVPILGILLYDGRNTIVFGKDTGQYNFDTPHNVSAGTRISILQQIRLDVAISDYSFEIGLNNMSYPYYIKRNMLTQEECDKSSERICVRSNAGFFSVIPRKIGDPTQIAFHGVAELVSKIDCRLRR